MGRLSNPPEPLETLVGQGIAVTPLLAERALKRARHSPIGSRSANLNNEGQLSNPVKPSPQVGRAIQVSRATTTKSNRVQKRLRTADIDELVAAYSAGVCVHLVAQRFALHRSTVMSHLRRRNVPPRQILTVSDHDTSTPPPTYTRVANHWPQSPPGSTLIHQQSTLTPKRYRI